MINCISYTNRDGGTSQCKSIVLSISSLISVRFVAYHALLGMTSFALCRASSIPPGSPQPRYARPRQPAEPDSEEEADFRGISVAEWRRRRGEKPGAETEDDDLPLSAIKAQEIPRTDVPGDTTPLNEASPYPPPSPVPVKSENRLLRRWCKECQGWKPPRCHHCRTCGVCILKVRADTLLIAHADYDRWTTIAYGSTHAWDTPTTRHFFYSSSTQRHSAPWLPKRRAM